MAPDAEINKIVHVQNECMKLILNAPPHADPMKLCTKLKILPFHTQARLCRVKVGYMIEKNYFQPKQPPSIPKDPKLTLMKPEINIYPS